MGNLSPVAFDIETTGFEPGAMLTVVGLATDMGAWLALNTDGRTAEADRLATELKDESNTYVRVSVFENEQRLLSGLADFATDSIDDSRHYLTAYNGERWSGGFDLPFVRSACVRWNVEWPFPDVAYADTMNMVERFNTGDDTDLVGAYDSLIGKEDCDPFDDSEQAVTAHSEGDWVSLLLHNLADVQRTRELAVLAGQYVPKSDFKMKNLNPPDSD